MAGQFFDMLGQELKVGDVIFRSRFRALERVTQVKEITTHGGSIYAKIQTKGFASLDGGCSYTAVTWYKTNTDVLKVSLTPEMESAAIIMDNDYSFLVPTFELKFKEPV